MDNQVKLKMSIVNLSEFIEQSKKVTGLAEQLAEEVKKLNQIELSAEVSQ